MGHSSEAIREFEKCGGTVSYRFDPVGYFWGQVPTVQLSKLLTVASIVDIQLDGPANSSLDYVEARRPTELMQASVWPVESVPSHPPGKDPHLRELSSSSGTSQLYLPWDQMGVGQFIQQHPTYDGRGTTIAIVEGYGDLLHPALQKALNIDGIAVPKIAGISDPASNDDVVYTATDHFYSPTITVTMQTDIGAQGSIYQFGGARLVLPRAGIYKLGALQNGGKTFKVLWSPEIGSVWVDTNRNGSFADEDELKDINREFRVSKFPSESGTEKGTLIRSTSFAVQILKDQSELKFFVGQDDHGTSVATIAAGNGLLAGAEIGIAPAARVLYVTRGAGSLHQTVKAFICATSRSDVDVVTASFVIKPLTPGETVTSLIIDRLAAVYQKPMFFTVTAGPYTTTDNISDLGVGEHVFGVMGYATPDVWSAMNGVEPPVRDNDPDGGGQGPTAAGVIKPDFLTPFYALAGGNCQPNAWEVTQATTASGYSLPACYTKFGGTSGSTPAAAALALLLISGAKQAHIQLDLQRMTWALRNSARYLDQFPEPIGYQGYGLPQVGSAWALLTSGEATPEFVSIARSNGPHEGERRAPHHGVGIYEYFGWHPGASGIRTIALIRRSGPDYRKTYSLRWRGNDQSFASADSISLRRNEPVNIAVRITARKQGIHQSILEIVDPSSMTVVHAIMNTVVVTKLLDRNNPSQKWSANVPLSHEQCALFDFMTRGQKVEGTISLRDGGSIISIGPSPLSGTDTASRSSLPNHVPVWFEYRKQGIYPIELQHPSSGPWAFCVRNHKGAHDLGSVSDRTVSATINLVLTDSRSMSEPKSDRSESSILNADSGQMLRLEQAYRLAVRSVPTKPSDKTSQDPAAISDGIQQFSLGLDPKVKHLRLLLPAELRAKEFAFTLYACKLEGLKRRCKLEAYQEDNREIDIPHPSSGEWILLAAKSRSTAEQHFKLSLLTADASGLGTSQERERTQVPAIDGASEPPR
jgi:hypothetical protein